MASLAKAAASEPEAERAARSESPQDLLALLVLILGLGLATFAATACIALLSAGSGEVTEWSLYIAAFGVILPGSLVGGLALARALTPRGLLTLVAVAWSGGVLAILLLVRLAYAVGGRSLALALCLVGLLALVATAAASARLALAESRPAGFERAAALAGRRWLLIPGVLLLGLLVGLWPHRVLAPAVPVAGLAGGAAILGIYMLLIRRRASRRLGIAFDGLALLLAAVLVNDLAFYSEPQRFLATTSDIHHNFYLGPVNDMLHGRPILVESFSQYGVGVFYFLAGWFQFAVPGYGALALLSGFLSAAMVALAYAILRLARASRPLALTAGAVIAVAVHFSQMPPPTLVPSTGGLRFLPPYLLIAVTLLSRRHAGTSRALSSVPLVVLGVASLWSLETFTYCLAAFVGMAGFRAAERGESSLPVLARRLGGEVAPGLAAVLIAHVLFAGMTRALVGSWPDWGWYLAFIRTYSVDGFGTLPIVAWSPALAICAVYFAALAAAVVWLRPKPVVCRQERLALLAIAGVVPFGLASFSYFLGRSFDPMVVPVGLPCYLAVALWLAVLEQRRRTMPAVVHVGAIAVAFAAAGMLVAFSWPTIKQRTPGTPLVMSLTGGGPKDALRELRRMWRSEPVGDRAEGGMSLLRRYFPGEGPALVVTGADKTVDILVHSGRVNVLPISDFLQDGLLPERSWPRVARAVERLRPGMLMLTESAALGGRSRSRLPSDVRAQLPPNPLLQRTVTAIKARFRLELVDRAGHFMVVRLQPRRP